MENRIAGRRRERIGGWARPIALVALALTLTAASACTQSAPATRGEYVASRRGTVYYWVGCDAWRSLETTELRWYPTGDAAREAGYRPSRSRGCGGPEEAVPASGSELAGRCTIERVVDGDTVVCREGAERVRLLLIDTPEMAQGEYGEAARDALASMLPEGTPVRLELDVRERDQYGRLLAYLHTGDGRMVNEEMVRLGYAVVLVYPPNVRHVERLREAAGEARAARRGLWAGSAFECAPADYRRGTCR